MSARAGSTVEWPDQEGSAWTDNAVWSQLSRGPHHQQLPHQDAQLMQPQFFQQQAVGSQAGVANNSQLNIPLGDFGKQSGLKGADGPCKGAGADLQSQIRQLPRQDHSLAKAGHGRGGGYAATFGANARGRGGKKEAHGFANSGDSTRGKGGMQLPDSDPQSFHAAFAQLSAHNKNHAWLKGDDAEDGEDFDDADIATLDDDFDNTGELAGPRSDDAGRRAEPSASKKIGKLRTQESQRAMLPVDANMVNVIAKCLANGDTDSAEMWIDSLDRGGSRRTSSKAFYNSLIHACGKAGSPDAAGWCAVRMLLMGLQPNLVTFNSILSACARVGNVQLATKWWKQMIAINQRPNNITYNTMVKVCAQARDATSAEMWVEEMITAGLKPCTVSFGTLIDVYAKIGQVAKAEELFDRMISASVEPDKVIFNSVINACAKAGSAGKAQQWFERMKNSGFDPDEKTYNSLINACAKASNVEMAEHWFLEMQRAGCKVDEITFGSIIHASANVGNVERAGYWMDRMQEIGIRPNLVCFNTVLHACAHCGDLQGTQKWLQRMFDSGVTPNKISYNIMMVAYEKAGDHYMAETWIRRMILHGSHPDQITHATLLRARAGANQSKQGTDESAYDTAARWAYQTLVKVYAELGNVHYTRSWLTNMLGAGYKPNQDFYECIRHALQSGKASAPRDEESMRRICSMIASACDEQSPLMSPSGLLTRQKGRGYATDGLKPGKGKGSGQKARGGKKSAGPSGRGGRSADSWLLETFGMDQHDRGTDNYDEACGEEVATAAAAAVLGDDTLASSDRNPDCNDGSAADLRFSL